ncbi:MAG: hypothetical protein HRT72_02845 [Flavobacteriales bacterium]|nr:hypothetical protein [Flavobacteriales bacterium]
MNIQEDSEQVFLASSFPVERNKKLIESAARTRILINEYDLDLVVNTTFSTIKYVFDSYAFNPLMYHDMEKDSNVISVNLDGDRRTWLFGESENCTNILLNGIKVEPSLLNNFDHVVISDTQLIIRNNDLKVSELFRRINWEFKNTHL